jgi:hypothetical protein
MTTTLVLTPEREAHIAELKQQTIEIRSTNHWDVLGDDDPIMIEATITLWDAMTDEEQEIFIGAHHLIEYAGIQSCQGFAGCGNIRHTYTRTLELDSDSPETSSPTCAECLAHSIYRYNFRELKTKARYLHDYQLSSMLEIKMIFPPATAEATECRRCTNFIAPEGVEVSHWYQPIEVYVDADHNTAIVHNRCSIACYGCNTHWVLDSYNRRIGGNHYCAPCFDKYEEADDIIECSYGDHYTFDDELTYSPVRDEDMCQECYDGYIECNDCGYEYSEDSGHTCEDDEQSSGYSEYIHNYSYRPRPAFYPNKWQPYYLGMELEVEVTGNDSRHDCAYQVVYALEDRAYLKEDGSLSHGFEIVTHPHTLSAYQNDIDWGFLKTLSKMGVRSWNRNSCGLHVHVSRTAFHGDTHAATEAHLVRFTKLIYDNQRQVERLAGRKNNTYATFNDKGKIVPKVKFGNQSSGRYSAVNMEPENTVEVRVFKGSLRKERVLSGIEFVAAAVEYTRNLKIQHKSAPFAWARFVHYVTANSDTYPNLFIIMNETFEKDNDPNGDN